MKVLVLPILIVVVIAVGILSGCGGKNTSEDAKYDVELTEAGPNKISVIKVVMDSTGFELKQAKDMVDGAPSVVKKGITKKEAEDLKKKLEAEGATAKIKKV